MYQQKGDNKALSLPPSQAQLRAKLLNQNKVIKSFPIMKTYTTTTNVSNRRAAALYLANIYIGEL